MKKVGLIQKKNTKQLQKQPLIPLCEFRIIYSNNKDAICLYTYVTESKTVPYFY